MKLELVRSQCGATCTIGDLYIDGTHACYTLEDIVRPDGEKVYGQTAIPYGRYRIDITYSPHFQRDLPLLLDVPNFEGVRIHPGNTAADTEGCILVGMEKHEGSITHSQVAFSSVFVEIREAIDHGDEVWLEIKESL